MAEAGSFLLAEVMLWLMYAVALVAVVVTLVSAIRPLLVSPRKPSGRSWAVVGFTLLLLLSTWLLASDRPMVINGTMFSDAFWLKTTDMLIVSSCVLMVVAALFVLYGVSGLNRRKILKNK